MANLEGKLKDERLMARISDAEYSQMVASLEQKIASLQLQTQELAVLDNLENLFNVYEDISDNEDSLELDKTPN